MRAPLDLLCVVLQRYSFFACNLKWGVCCSQSKPIKLLDYEYWLMVEGYV